MGGKLFGFNKRPTYSYGRWTLIKTKAYMGTESILPMFG